MLGLDSLGHVEGFSSYWHTCREARTSRYFSFLDATALNHLEQDASISDYGNKNGN